MKHALVLLLLLAGLVVTGCGGDDEAAATGRVYFVRGDTVWPVAREVDSPEAALEALFEGPTSDEADALELSNAWSSGQPPPVSVSDDVALVELGDGLFPETGIAQIVYTLTDLPGIGSVEINSRSLTRDDFEEQTPTVLVESPLAFEEVSAPITATGTANTFEANFLYELLDEDGNVIDENFVTATSGTGTRGTFEFTTADVDGVATLVVFEESAEDGSRIREVEIPLSAP